MSTVNGDTYVHSDLHEGLLLGNIYVKFTFNNNVAKIDETSLLPTKVHTYVHSSMHIHQG